MRQIYKTLVTIALACAVLASVAAAKEDIDLKTCFSAIEADIICTETCDAEREYAVLNEKGELLFSASVCNDDVYTTTYLNLRTVPTTESEKVRVLAPNTKLNRIGNSQMGWDIVLIDDEKYFVFDQYLQLEPLKEVKAKTNYKSSETSYVESNYSEEASTSENFEGEAQYSSSYFKRMGEIYEDGYRWTWYSQKVLPGGGLDIPGRHVDESNYVCDENDYICVASNDLPEGTVVDTPFGKQGKVYDSGCPSGTLDVYCNF